MGLIRHSTASVQKAMGGPKATAKFFSQLRLESDELAQLSEQDCSSHTPQCWSSILRSEHMKSDAKEQHHLQQENTSIQKPLSYVQMTCCIIFCIAGIEL